MNDGVTQITFCFKIVKKSISLEKRGAIDNHNYTDIGKHNNDRKMKIASITAFYIIPISFIKKFRPKTMSCSLFAKNMEQAIYIFFYFLKVYK